MAKRHEMLQVSSIRIIGEQDGVPERELKARFSEFLAGTELQCRAYLARVDYETRGEFNVALLVRLESGDPEFVNRGLGKIFQGFFNPTQHLDIVFLSENKEKSIASLVRPSFSSSV